MSDSSLYMDGHCAPPSCFRKKAGGVALSALFALSVKTIAIKTDNAKPLITLYAGLLATYEELEVKRQNFLFLNFLLRGHPYTLLVGCDYTLIRISFEQHCRLQDNPSGHQQSDLIKGNRKNVATHLCGTHHKRWSIQIIEA